MNRRDEYDPARDWGAPGNGATSLAPVGFCEGHDLGFKRGVGAAMLALRDELIAGGTEPGVAALVAQKLGRACGVSGT